MASVFFDAGSAPKPRRPHNPHAADEPLAAPPRRRTPKRLFPKELSRAALLQGFAALIWLPQAACLAWAIGAIMKGEPFSAALTPALVVLTLGILRAAIDAIGCRMAFRIARSQLSQRRAAAVDALAARSPLDIARPSSGLAASLIGEQAEAVTPYISRFLPARIKASLVPLAIIVCVLPISWVAALILILTAPLIPVFMALIGWKAKEASERQLAATGGLNGFLLDRLRGLATIRALAAVDATALRLRADADGLRHHTMAVLRIAFLSSAVLELFSSLGVAATAVYVGFSLLGSINVGTWHGNLTLTQGLFILLLAPAFFEPLRELSAVWHDRAAGEAAMDALDNLAAPAPLLLGEGRATAQTSTFSTSSPANIQIENLCLQHNGRQAVFEDLCLAIRPGEHVALLGPSGSGKTTLLSLIAGLGKADAGQISIGGMRVCHATADAIRQRIAWIGQPPHIFARSIIRNIGLDRPDISNAAAAEAARLMHLGDQLRAQRQIFLGDGGVGLSGGEALRVGLARAAAVPSIDIILADEPTAHLDGNTAGDITASLLKLAKGRTLIVATHDPALAARMDRVIRLETRLGGEAA